MLDSQSWLPYMEKTTNYNNWIFDLFKSYLGSVVLEVGSGVGTFTKYLLTRSQVLSLELTHEEVTLLRKQVGDKAGLSFFEGDICASATVQKLKGYNVDTVVCLNVLEHIKDDLLALKNMHTLLKKGGHLILYVPALEFLYGSLDKNLDHYRRYDKKKLLKLIKEAGFVVKEARFINILGAFTWFLYSRILKRKKVAEKRLLFYDKMFIPILRFFESLIYPPFGQSLFVVAVKQ
ncbi:MAG: class I SAM-dependent methyltransferase [Candidatus Saganbacteria bacterium]|nr:class I SAM-dependent methyltransferase [Candidatus Saganbacteria bacterium]